VGTGSRASGRDSRGEHSDFLLADAPVISAGFPSSSGVKMKSHSKGEKPTVSAAANKNHEKYEKMLRTALAEARSGLAEGGIRRRTSKVTRLEKPPANLSRHNHVYDARSLLVLQRIDPSICHFCSRILFLCNERATRVPVVLVSAD
jgi:hypothetical protein